jgi:hypothetical protein
MKGDTPPFLHTLWWRLKRELLLSYKGVAQKKAVDTFCSIVHCVWPCMKWYHVRGFMYPVWGSIPPNQGRWWAIYIKVNATTNSSLGPLTLESLPVANCRLRRHAIVTPRSFVDVVSVLVLRSSSVSRKIICRNLWTHVSHPSLSLSFCAFGFVSPFLLCSFLPYMRNCLQLYDLYTYLYPLLLWRTGHSDFNSFAFWSSDVLGQHKDACQVLR